VKIDAAFITSAAAACDLPHDDLPQIALAGRSNVGKSTLINALVRQRIARTSRTPGKTRLANIYRVRRGGRAPLYLVDLPGYGYAPGRSAELAAAAGAYFEHARASHGGLALLLVDARHPGLPIDVEAWSWLDGTVARAAIVATKIDTLSRAERQRAMKTYDAVFENSVLPVSAVTGEGLDELWTLIDQLASTSSPRPRSPGHPRARAPRPATLPRS
jgi:GTP-binding protein